MDRTHRLHFHPLPQSPCPGPLPQFQYSGAYMKRLFLLGTALLTFAATAAAQDKIFDWIRASDENAQLDPMDYHVGRVYRPAPGGGNMHIDIRSKLPVTV